MSESFRIKIYNKTILKVFNRTDCRQNNIFIQQKTKLTPFLSEVSLLIN